ncbi:MAG: carboxypeptidase regulatory-like domain-containing protein [Deltaproteobacteria bacterium]|nr:carboxypeptidase regulatory-like domain-containing protein [Deltaproteobacteria bacterium]
MLKLFMFIWVATLSTLAHPAYGTTPGYSRKGLHGGDSVGVLVDAPGPVISAGVHGGYGIVESIPPLDGPHHSLTGSFSGAVYLAPWFSTALRFDGLIQTHPKDEFDQLGKDRSVLGQAYLILRSGVPLSSKLLLGGELRVWIPGGDAPSLEWSAATFDLVPLLTVSPTPTHTLSFKTGFRFDQSENAAADIAHVRYGDRVSFPESSYHGVLAGVLWMYHLQAVSLWAELSADVLIGAPISQSPMRIGAGVQYPVHPRIQLNLQTTVSLSGRPEISTSSSLIPIEPRVLFLAGAIITFGNTGTDSGAGTNTDSRADDVSQTSIDPEQTGHFTQPSHSGKDAAPPTAVGTIASRILDRDGFPIAGAKVTVIRDGFQQTAVTNRDGEFEVPGVPVGNATVHIEMPFFDSRTETVQVTEGTVWDNPLPPLLESEVGSQIRGLVRNLKGDPLLATVTVSPGNTRIATTAAGEFQMDVEEGTYRVTISSKGYKSQQHSVTVGSNSVEILNVELRRK